MKQKYNTDLKFGIFMPIIAIILVAMIFNYRTLGLSWVGVVTLRDPLLATEYFSKYLHGPEKGTGTILSGDEEGRVSRGAIIRLQWKVSLSEVVICPVH